MSDNSNKTGKRGRGRPPKENSAAGSNTGSDKPTTKPAKSTKPKLGYKVFVMDISQDISAAYVTGDNDTRLLYVRVTGQDWHATDVNGTFGTLLVKAFSKRGSDARHVSSFMRLQDVSLPAIRTEVQRDDYAEFEHSMAGAQEA